jgi:hypothetical protein
MKFVMIDPKQRTVSTIDVASIEDAMRTAGLTPGRVDFGAITRNLSYVVYEFGLFTPASEQHYAAVGNTLIAGPCVMFGVGEEGETLDLVQALAPPVLFFRDAAEVEVAIAAGQIRRPEMAVNNEVLWHWPQPPLKGMTR